MRKIATLLIITHEIKLGTTGMFIHSRVFY